MAVRATADAAWQAVLRVLVAAVRSGSTFSLSTPVGLPAAVRHLLGESGVAVSVESDAEWLQRLAGGIPDAAADDADTLVTAPRPGRLRLVGPADTVAALRTAVAETVGGDVSLTVYANEVTTAVASSCCRSCGSRRVSIGAFRFGAVDAWSAAVI